MTRKPDDTTHTTPAETKEPLMAAAYCPTCRTHHPIDTSPPYSVIHRGGQHLHPITRDTLATTIEEHAHG